MVDIKLARPIITAQVIADSVSAISGDRITTMRWVYPRIVHGEIMTHRLFSRNASSSRAIPVKRVLKMVEESPASVLHWGANEKGMQASGEVDDVEGMKALWLLGAKHASRVAKQMMEKGAHKQVANRILEPYQYMTTVVTSTDFENFMNLRHHKDADPTFAELARVVRVAIDASNPKKLREGEWHMPFVDSRFAPVIRDTRAQFFYDEEGTLITLQEALKISSSCVAQTSFRRENKSLDKAENIYATLIESEPVHASPVEPQATPMGRKEWNARLKARKDLMEEGIPEPETLGTLMCANFKGWRQHRKMIPNESFFGNFNEKLKTSEDHQL